MPNCEQCDTQIRSGSLCQICAVERNHAGVDHDHDDTKTCAWCKQTSAEGHYARTGRWLCHDCEREQLATLTDAVDPGLEAVVQWAVGGSEPEADPGTLATGFETASTRAIADGGFHTVTRDGQEYAVVRWQEFDDDADLEIAEDGAIENYDEVGKHTSIRLISADAIREQGMQDRVIGPDHRHWREGYDDLEPGEEVRPEEVGA